MKRIIAPILFTVLLIISGIVIFTTRVEDENAQLIIRFDDYGIWCNKQWVDLERRLLFLHEKYGVKISFTVVPNSIYPVVYHPKSLNIYPHQKKDSINHYPLLADSERVKKLKESSKKGISEIGQHGYYHPKYYSNIKNSEFFNVPYDVQFKKIKEGKAILDSLFNQNTILFAPPHNSYDGLTLDALTECGFEILTAKDRSEDAPVDTSISLTYLPYTTENFLSLMRKYQKDNGRSTKGRPIDVLLIHHTSFTNSEGVVSENGIREYEDFLSLIKEKSIRNYHFSDIYKNNRLLRENNGIRKKIYNKLAIISDSLASKILDSGIGYKFITFSISFYFFLLTFLGTLTVLVIRNKGIKKLIPTTVFVILCLILFCWIIKLLLMPFEQSIIYFISTRFWLLLSVFGVSSAFIVYKKN